uniref:Uncharacterized protein n=1 Tax=Arundo donax TaxID=35708 RepID=A0A0A9F0L5_ARUDO
MAATAAPFPCSRFLPLSTGGSVPAVLSLLDGDERHLLVGAARAHEQLAEGGAPASAAAVPRLLQARLRVAHRRAEQEDLQRAVHAHGEAHPRRRHQVAGGAAAAAGEDLLQLGAHHHEVVLRGGVVVLLRDGLDGGSRLLDGGGLRRGGVGEGGRDRAVADLRLVGGAIVVVGVGVCISVDVNVAVVFGHGDVGDA